MNLRPKSESFGHKLAAREKEQWIQLERDKFYSLAEASPFGLVVISPRGDFRIY